MKLSQIDYDALSNLSDEQKTRIAFGAVSQNTETGDIALLLGTRPLYWEERCRAAADLYLDGKVRYIMPTGGVLWEYDGRNISEADGMKEMLVGMGIPEEVILTENEARTTVENMIYCTLQMYRRFHFEGIKTVYVVTSPGHLTRSLILAEALLPREIRILGYGGESYAYEKAHWQDSERGRTFTDQSILHTRRLIDRGLLTDLEF